MSAVFDHPDVTHTLAAAVRLVDAFTGVPLRERYDLRLAGADWWVPHFRATDATYRFLVTHRPVPALGAVAVTITPRGQADPHRDDDGALTLTIPPAGAPPVPLDIAYYLTLYPLWPARTFRPPPGETFVRGLVRRAGTPLTGHRVQIAAGATPGPATPAAPTDDDGQFAYRLPALRVQAANPTSVVTAADLFFAVADGAGVAQTVTAPALPLTVPIGQVTAVTLDLA